MGSKFAVVDACCAINLLATNREIEIVRALDMVLLHADWVRRETESLWTPPDSDGVRKKEPASLDRLRAAGLLEQRSLDTTELIDAFVLAAEQINDADASCIALAGVMKVPLITDDTKERRVARTIFASIELVSTLDLVYDAALALGWNDAELVQVAIALRWRGNFAPPRRDPRREWYVSLLARAGVQPT
jgi:predicted nucleic acid-binding protein